MPKKSTKKEFIQKSRFVHGDLYDYSKVEYIGAHEKVIIICKEHGDFEQRCDAHCRGNICPICSKNKEKYSTEDFIKKSRSIHGNKYDYSKVKYINNKIKVIIGCPVHGYFEQTPSAHFNKHGCPECGGSKKLTTKEFILKANEVHGNKYDYSKAEYIGAHEKVIIICKEHGDFEQTPDTHYNSGCKLCNSSNIFYSKKAIIWLNQIAKEENIYIQHAENIGEYHIPGTRYKADGYCSSNNTIYEFYGDRFHGNLNLFEKDEQCHPFNDETAGSLYTKTKQREQEIKDLGYNLITIWEEDY